MIHTWTHQLNQRKALFPEVLASPGQCLRLLDDKHGTGYACDKFGDRLWFYRFRATELEAEEREAMARFTAATGLTKSSLRQMSNRGQAPALTSGEEILWTAREGTVNYQLAEGRGWSPGLFLDQRDNRKWVHDTAAGKKLLNLFCYTGGFSLNAALGGATEVVSVDTSKQTLQWCKQNFQLNELDPARYEFWASDARDFLQGCTRRRRQFDLIVCDPPSFARSKQHVFTIEKDAPNLVQSCLDCLLPGGSLLFACNYEKWSRQDLHELATRWAQPHSPLRVQLLPRSRDYADDAPMKSVLISMQQGATKK